MMKKLYTTIPNNKLPKCLLKPLIFGDIEQLAALEEVETMIRNKSIQRKESIQRKKGLKLWNVYVTATTDSVFEIKAVTKKRSHYYWNGSSRRRIWWRIFY